MRRIQFSKPKFSRKSAGLIIVLAVLSVTGLAVTYKAAARSDRDKSYDLYTIRATVMDFYSDQGRLPERIKELGIIPLRGALKDYELRRDYKEYMGPDERGIYVVKREPDTFYYTLCTRFASPGPALNPYGFHDFTDHGIGRKCYKMDVFQQGITSAKYSLDIYPEELKDYFAE